MSAVKEAFEKMGNAIKHACEAMIDNIKALAESLIGALKHVLETTMAVLKALATGNLLEVGKKLLELAQELANLPGDLVSEAVEKAVQTALKFVAETLGFADKPWMKEAMNLISVGSNFTSLGKAAEFMGQEALAMATGQSSQLQQTFEHHLPKDIT